MFPDPPSELLVRENEDARISGEPERTDIPFESEGFARAVEYVRAIRAGQSNTDAVLQSVMSTRRRAA